MFIYLPAVSRDALIYNSWKKKQPAFTKCKVVTLLEMNVHGLPANYSATQLCFIETNSWGCYCLRWLVFSYGRNKNKKEKKSEAKSGVIISTCGAKSLKESPMFGDLSLGRDRVSGRNKKTFSTFVSGMKESHLSLATVENSCDTVDQTRLPESAGGLRTAKYLQFLQQTGLCLTPAVAQLRQFVMIWYSENDSHVSEQVDAWTQGGRNPWPTRKIKGRHCKECKSDIFFSQAWHKLETGTKYNQCDAVSSVLWSRWFLRCAICHLHKQFLVKAGLIIIVISFRAFRSFSVRSSVFSLFVCEILLTAVLPSLSSVILQPFFFL